MKKIFQFCLIPVLTLSCSVKKKLKVDYVFPLSVEKKLKEKIEQQGEKADYFVIFKNEKSYNELTLVKIANENDKFYGFYNVKNSNYRVLVDKNFYSLVFDTDLTYAIKFCDSNHGSFDERIKMQSTENGFCVKKPPVSIYHNAFIIKFNNNGIILE